MSPELPAALPLALLLLALFVLLAVARRVRVIRILTNLAMLGLLGFLLFVTIDQRAQFDPMLGRVARLLQFDRQEVSGEELRIRMAPDGHFWADVSIGGVRRRMLIDSGATITALSTDTAAAAGLDVRDGPMPVILNTANGAIRAQTATAPELRLGNIVAREMAVVVSPAFGDANVLGMNFLSRLKSWRVEGSTLILVPHHPQAIG